MADDQNGLEDWEIWWDARVAALESVLGQSDDEVGHAAVPFEFGIDAGGAADILYFRKHVDGKVSVTCNLIGCVDQPASELGWYELMICHRDDDDTGPNMISRLALFTTQSVLQPMETMDIQSAVKQSSTIVAFLFHDYARFTVFDEPAGLLLCIGITKDELEACRRGDSFQVLKSLKEKDVFPFTDWQRTSVL